MPVTPRERSHSCGEPCAGLSAAPRILEGLPSRLYAQKSPRGCVRLRVRRHPHEQRLPRSAPPNRPPSKIFERLLLACGAWLDQLVKIVRLVIHTDQVRVLRAAMIVDRDCADVFVHYDEQRDRLRTI